MFIIFPNQFGYDSSATKRKRLQAMESWAKENFPHSDSDPDHADAIVLITRRCVLLNTHNNESYFSGGIPLNN